MLIKDIELKFIEWAMAQGHGVNKDGLGRTVAHTVDGWKWVTMVHYEEGQPGTMTNVVKESMVKTGRAPPGFDPTLLN